MRKNRYKIDRSKVKDVLTEKVYERFYRHEWDMLKPYFKFKNGKSVFLQTMEIIKSDCLTDFTIFKAKPGAFKTTKQEEEDGLNHSPFVDKEFTVADYLTSKNNYDLMAISLIEIFRDEKMFKTLYDFYNENYDKLKFNHYKTYKIKWTQ